MPAFTTVNYTDGNYDEARLAEYECRSSVAASIASTAIVPAGPIRSIYSQKRNETIETALTLAQAKTLCLRARADFPRDLANRRSLSDEQIFWLYKLANEQMDREAGIVPASPAPAATGLDISAIRTLFVGAARNLRTPRITLTLNGDLPGTSPDAEPIVLRIAGPTSRYSGEILILGKSDSYDPDTRQPYYGRITNDGAFIASATGSRLATLPAFLARFAASPATVAGLCGRLTGKCCLCSRPLSDARSTAVGYGATCAESWSLPYGQIETDLASGSVRPRTTRRRTSLSADAIAELAAEGRIVTRGE